MSRIVDSRRAEVLHAPRHRREDSPARCQTKEAAGKAVNVGYGAAAGFASSLFLTPIGGMIVETAVGVGADHSEVGESFVDSMTTPEADHSKLVPFIPGEGY